ncbi:Stk1 family PASTA domain-containing Ser/Thr kinase [Streptomyces sp. Wb2n-11]|uniref:Stk1 family PASTA domain-containing Ser/Thr kinase n=1 Tax=Streptomyces sp. Wb2n-11 TaxID=1030533 RepID=UPI000B1BADE5|nr:Stk1 family PASTA domain-containing Ser/Thr kinase [Streptomyces sp. Wb2n-11]
MEEPRRLGGRYELGSVLGRGGMAEVYIAHDTRLGRTVAVKTLRVDLARDPSFQARFRREAQSAASLNHPAIVAVYDTGEDYVDNVSIPYIVMEYVDGSTLRELLHSGRKLLPERTLEMTVGILQALEYSHRAQIVHRDIKPANVMLTRTGQVKVMDFGIARAMGDSGMTMTQTAAVIGTAQYLSPEQAKGEQVDARSDLYSTGCLLYELLTVRPPFIGDSPVAVAYQHVREEPQPPSNFDPEITPEMDAIVLKALVKDPNYRYQSADEMRADIEACLDGRPVAATSALGAVGYGGYPDDQPTTALHAADASGGHTSILPPVNPDDGGYGYDDRPDRRRQQQQKKSSLSTILLVLAGILVLVGAILIGRSLSAGDNSTEGVPVPTLIGENVADARGLAKNADLTLEVGDRKECEDQPEGKICEQTPAGGEEVEPGSSIKVVVSTGAPKIEVPDVMDQSKDRATENLEAKGFDVETKSVESEKTVGTVIDQDPEGGTKAEKGETITISIAKTSKADVPDVVGQDFEAAKKQLSDLGFVVAREEEESAQTPNSVLKQTPVGGSRTDEGGTITLTVAKAPAQEQVAVPGVTGQKLKDARKAIEDAGLTVGTITEPQDDEAIVVLTQPAAGQQVPKGTPVNFTTAAAPGDNNGGGDNSGNENGGGNNGGGNDVGGLFGGGFGRNRGEGD